MDSIQDPTNTEKRYSKYFAWVATAVGIIWFTDLLHFIVKDSAYKLVWDLLPPVLLLLSCAFFFKDRLWPSYICAFSAMMATIGCGYSSIWLAVVAALSLGMHFSLHVENKKHG